MSEAGNAEPVRVFLVDDHELIRRGLHDLLDAADGVEPVGEASSVEEALRRLPAVRPEVAVLDVRLPDGSGVELCREILSRSPGTRCLMLTSHADEQAVVDSIMAGAAGFLIKDARGPELVDAIRRVAAGQSLLDPAITGRVLERIRAGTEDDPAAGLTEQERRILDLIGDGLSNRQIAEHMHLSEKTVKNYVSKLLSKLGMERRTQAAVFAVRRQQRPSG